MAVKPFMSAKRMLQQRKGEGRREGGEGRREGGEGEEDWGGERGRGRS